jgi:hypothetical protein
MRPVETIPGMGGKRERRMMKGRIQLWHTVNTFVNVTMYPQHNNNFLKKHLNLFQHH